MRRFKFPKREMVEEQSFVSGLSGYLSGLHADGVERSAKGSSARSSCFSGCDPNRGRERALKGTHR